MVICGLQLLYWTAPFRLWVCINRKITIKMEKNGPY